MATESRGGSAVLNGTETATPAHDAAHPPFQRFEHLSTSASGLHYVRDRKTGTVRMLTAEELQDFNDPPPCPECGEQFGCDHFNCAREPLLSEPEIESDVPPEWRTLARVEGLSRNDLDRLSRIVEREGEYRVIGTDSPDMRTLELVLLLNETEAGRR